MSEVEIDYQVKGIQPYPFKKGYVCVMLEPLEALEDDKQDSPFKIQSNFPIPKEIQQNIAVMVEQTRGKKDRINHDCRDIIIIMSEPDYHTCGWGFGDIVSTNFTKVKEGRDFDVEKL